MRPAAWKIVLLVETDDEAFVEGTADAIGAMLCGAEETLGPEHRCDPPWFIVSSPLPKKKAKRWRPLLNR